MRSEFSANDSANGYVVGSRMTETSGEVACIAGGTGIPALFSHLSGIHCWYCWRKFTGVHPLIKTKDHIIPKSRGGVGVRNFVAACNFCNELKANMTPKQFAIMLERRKKTDLECLPLIDVMIFQAWKAHNKFVMKLKTK